MVGLARLDHHRHDRVSRQLHRDAATAHALKRAAERSPKPLTFADLAAHEVAISEGRTVCIGGHAQRQLHRVAHGRLTFYAVWCCQLQCIVTYLATPSQWRGRLTTDAWGPTP